MISESDHCLMSGCVDVAYRNIMSVRAHVFNYILFPQWQKSNGNHVITCSSGDVFNRDMAAPKAQIDSIAITQTLICFEMES